MGTQQPGGSMDARTIGDGPGTRVTVEVDWNVVEASIEADLFDAEPGADEGADAELEAWRDGAVQGAEHALATANALPCALRITEIWGESENTNATIVAAAAAHAVWEAIGYVPTVEERHALDRAVSLSLTTGGPPGA